MENYIKRYAQSSLIVSLLLTILSLFLIIKPEMSLFVLFIFIGCILFVVGIMHTISYFSSPKEFKSFSFELVEGIFYGFLGMLIIFNPNIIKAFLPMLIGCWIIIDSIIKFQLSFNMKSYGSSNWALMLLLSIITLIIGIIMVINPFGSATAITMICGIMLLIYEIINIFESVSMIKVYKK